MRHYCAVFSLILSLFVFSQMTVAAPEVYVLDTGYVTAIPGRQLVPGVDENNGGRYVKSTVGLVISDNAITVVDPGFTIKFKRIKRALFDIGIKLKDVTHVFLSHHHPDHTHYAGLFKNAILVDFWATYDRDLWEDHPDNWDIDTDVTVVRTPGHSNEDASLLVETADGSVIFTHTWWDETFFPAIDPIADSQADLDNSRELVKKLADCFIMGHGSYIADPTDLLANCEMVTDLTQD